MQDFYVIVSAVRTPIGKYGGAFKNIDAGKLASIAVKGSIEEAGLSPEQISEVILGEVRQTSESSNIGRVAALRAGVPETSPAYTVNRLCASGMQAISSAVQQIAFNQSDIVVAGGVESMSRSPIYIRNSRFGGDKTKLVDSNLEAGQQPKEIYGNNLNMGVTAENVAGKYDISRIDQDEFALESQNKASRAISNNRFREEIIPVTINERKKSFAIKEDEHPRPEVTIEKLKNLPPVFKEEGTVTAGNACGRNDGSAALVIMKQSKAKKLGLTPLVKIKGWETSGVSPEIMGIGPIPAVEKLLKNTNKSKEEIGLFELNEAFASQSLAVIRELDLELEKVNVNGGAIALGHPVGASGARIVTTLLHEMMKRKEKLGVATLCAGGGQGMAMMLELL